MRRSGRGSSPRPSLCFDLSVFELFLSLATGGTVVLIAEEASRLTSLPEVGRKGPRAGVRSVNTIPSAARRAAAEPKPLPPIGADGGEHWPTSRSRRTLTAALADSGRTRLSRISMAPRRRRPTRRRRATSPPRPRRAPGADRAADRRLGGAWCSTGRLHPVPARPRTGELYLAGAGLAQRLPRACRAHRRPRLHSTTPSVPSCRGAALPHRRPAPATAADGAIEFLGRRDSQVKVRGLPHRAGRGGGGARPPAGGDRRRRRGARRRPRRPPPRRLRGARRRRRLDLAAPSTRRCSRRSRADAPAPSWCCPELPRTAGGKVDRAALRAPASGAPPASTSNRCRRSSAPSPPSCATLCRSSASGATTVSSSSAATRC